MNKKERRKEYLKKWRETNKEHIQNYKKEYAKTHDSSFKKMQDKCKQLQQENQQLKKDIKNVINILNKNCDDLEATEEEFESLDRCQNE